MLETLVLAGGASTRMGRPKAALPLPDGRTFLAAIVDTLLAAGLPHVTVVTGADDDAVRDAWRGDPATVRFVVNARWAEGQLTSILAGLDAVETTALEGVLMTLVDVPLVSAETVRAIVEAWRRTRAPIVRPARGDTHGHPVIFDRAVLADLRRADPAEGAKPVVRRHAAAILNVEVDDPGAFRDVDTPEAYAALFPGTPGPV